MSWRRSGYYRAAERQRELVLPFNRGSEEWIKYLQPECVTAGCRDIVLCCLLGGSLESVVSGDFASGCLHAVGFVGIIAQVGCFCLGLWSAYGAPSESVVSGEVGGSRPPITRPGLAPGGPRPQGLPAAPGGPSESIVSGEVGGSRPPIMRPGTASGRAASAEDVGCICRSRAVPE